MIRHLGAMMLLLVLGGGGVLWGCQTSGATPAGDAKDGTKDSAKDSAEASKSRVEPEGDQDPLANDVLDPNGAEDANTPEPPKVAPASLPLPNTRTFFGLRRFLEEYADAYRPYAPLQNEYRALFQALAFLEDPTDAELTPARTRVRENVERAHWAFVAGVHETLDFFANRSRDMLHIDKEKNFVRRMKVLAFFAQELDASAGTPDKYTAFVRALYIETSERHFGRRVKPREKSGEPVP